MRRLSYHIRENHHPILTSSSGLKLLLMIVTFFSVFVTAKGSAFRLLRSTNFRLLFFAKFEAPVVVLFG